MGIILNIGLAVNRETNVVGNYASDVIPFNEVLRALPTWHIADLRLLQSHTERTLVVELNTAAPWVLDVANRIALQFDQDCVAVYNRVTNEGRLIGPRADRWGAFNPALFFLCNGQSLTEAQLRAGYGHPTAGV